ncbi:ankyrin [Polyplosphaeria fusca]|uniref:Ankyrin n=1 Tax=Polyplosphaeria fusca TaxID=682080 RepID=A0A9P4R117_9PLEO|nr:ankyrin [Polyplosphaeria fusca]
MNLILFISIRKSNGILPNLSIPGGGLNFSNLIPNDSEIVVACERGDTLAVRELFRQKKAAPNDVTVDGQVLLWYAVSSRSAELVRFLINAGAPVRPTQLLSASGWRQPDIARLLLLAGANVEVSYRNGLTAASYLYGKSRGERVPQTEFLEILANNSFSNFNGQDNNGWTVLHRAAAWGTAANVRTLIKMQTSIWSRTTKLDWTPQFIAVCFKNLDTLQELWNQHTDADFKNNQDFRGWNMLHMAAGYGKFDAVPFLIQQGVELGAMSKPTSRSVPYSVRGISVTPNELARCFGEDAYRKWAEALRVSG